MAHLVVPVQGDATEQFPLPVDCYLVVFFEGAFQILCELDAFALDPKIIHDNTVHNWAPHVAVQAGDELCLVVPTLQQALLE